MVLSYILGVRVVFLLEGGTAHDAKRGDTGL